MFSCACVHVCGVHVCGVHVWCVCTHCSVLLGHLGHHGVASGLDGGRLRCLHRDAAVFGEQASLWCRPEWLWRGQRLLFGAPHEDG